MKPRTANRLGVVLLLSTIVLSAVGQLAMKVGMQTLHSLAATRAFALTPAALNYFAPALGWTAAGIAAYVLSLLAWLAALVRYRLSYAYPLLGLSYVLVYFGATHWSRLMEPATPLRSFGTLLILAGVWLVSLGQRREQKAPSAESADVAESISNPKT